MHPWSLILVVAAGLLGLHACGRTTSAQPAAVPLAPVSCTGYRANTSVTVADFRDGVVLSYSAEPNDVPSLRAAVRRFVDQQSLSRPSSDRDRARLPPLAAPGTTLLLPGVDAAMSETPTGANVILTPVPPALRELLREDVRARRCLGQPTG